MYDLVQKNRLSAVKACHTIGKTRGAADVLLHWLFMRTPSMVITTSKSDHQVKHQLWKEIRHSWYTELPPFLRARGECLTAYIWMTDPQTGKRNPIHMAYGRATDEAGRLQGEHSENMLVIVDEAGEVPDDTFGIIESFEPEKIFLIGNPVRSQGYFYEAFEDPDTEYATLTIAAPDTPNFSGESVSKKVRGALLKPRTVNRWIRMHGESSPFVRARVYGEFPAEDADVILIPVSWSKQARDRGKELPSEWHPGAKKRPSVSSAQIGLDIAVGGKARTVMALRVDHVLVKLEEWRRGLTTDQLISQTVDAACRVRDEWRCPVEVVVDRVGAGSFTDQLPLHSAERIHYTLFGANESADDPQVHLNKRAQAHLELREHFRPGGARVPIAICVEGDPLERFVQQAGSVTYGRSGRSRASLKVESKEDMTRRNMPSPDELDAVVLAFWQAEKLMRGMEFSREACIEIPSLLADFPREW